MNEWVVASGGWEVRSEGGGAACEDGVGCECALRRHPPSACLCFYRSVSFIFRFRPRQHGSIVVAILLPSVASPQASEFKNITSILIGCHFRSEKWGAELKRITDANNAETARLKEEAEAAAAEAAAEEDA